MRKKLRLLSLFYVVILILIPAKGFSQSLIVGSITDNNNNPISYASIALVSANPPTSHAGFISNKFGDFSFETNKTGSHYLYFSALGYDTHEILIELGSDQKINLNVVLNEKPLELNEVVIEASRAIIIKKDTIVFDAESFLIGNEQVIEDLLRNIPGLNVDNEGTIKIGDREVEKIMVEGDDFFGRGYKLMSKNMPFYAIDKVELLNNYSHNRLLRGIEQTDRVAINLKLKKGMKSLWFGNSTLGYGPISDHHFDLKANLMNFGIENKYYFFSNLNNTGFDATGDIDHLIKPLRIDEPVIVGDNQQMITLLDLSIPDLGFQQMRTNFNNAKLVSLNAIFSPLQDLKLKTLAFLNWDQTSFNRNAIDNYSAEGFNFFNTENIKLRNSKRIAFGKIEAIYDISETQMFETETRLSFDNFNDSSNLLFNDLSTNEKLFYNYTRFDQKLIYSNMIDSKRVFFVSGRYIFEEAPQKYRTNRLFSDELISDLDSSSNVIQNVTSQMQFAGLEAIFMNRQTINSLMEIKLGHDFRKDILESSFFINDQDASDDLINKTHYDVNNMYVHYKHVYTIKRLSIIGNLKFQQLFYSLENLATSDKNSHFFISPGISLDWIINDKNKFSASYSYATKNAQVIDVYSNYILTDFNAFSKGTGLFSLLDASTFFLNYQLGNWSDRIFINNYLMYGKNHNYFSTNSFFAKDFTLIERILVSDREYFNLRSKIDYFLKSLSSSVSLGFNYFSSEFKNVVNNSGSLLVNTKTLNVESGVRSGFQGAFNFHMGAKWTANEIQSTANQYITNNTVFLDLFFVFNERFNTQILAERNMFMNLSPSKSFYFLDCKMQYVVKKNRLSLELSGSNLLNTDTFTNLVISDVRIRESTFMLLPRIVMFNISFRF
jgi:hypothetical protein